MTDIHNYQRHLKQALQRLSSSSIEDEDKQLIKGFADRLQAEGISKGRIVKYINHLKICAELVGFGQERPWFKESTRKDVERLVGRIEASDYKPHTKHDYKVVLRRFYQWLKECDRGDEEYPEEVSWIKTTIKKNEKKLPEDLLSEEEVLRIADHALCQRDRAFTLLLYDSGGRIGEILPLRIKDVTFDEYGAKIRVSGKTGEKDRGGGLLLAQKVAYACRVLTQDGCMVMLLRLRLLSQM
ncbi:MAG: tyrosine-type recombinase/integrase [Nitrososphaerales archaeon]